MKKTDVFIRLIVISIGILIPVSVWAQPATVLISQGTASTCNGVLYDTGGIGASGYQNNETYTLTICPDVPGDVITLDWINFNLDVTNTAPPPGNNIDNITIYDGNSTAAPTLGTYTGSSLSGLLVSGTTFNTSGCLTLVWESNDAGTGVFAATITCTTPCQRPTVVMNSPLVGTPVKICDGETVNFDASGSYPAPGFNIVDWIWNWGDGTVDTLTTGVVSHTFNSGPGEYNVNLYLIDDNGCISTNLETVQVLVGTEPTFIGTSADTILCLGESVCIEGFVQPTLWTGQPINSLGGATYLPDDVGQCFTATLEFQGFLPGQTLTNINDLLEICVSMEHSYMGDLVASIYCPDGTGVIMHQQNGGSTNLGDPNQLDDSTLIGTCEEYCWSPTATNGTWVDNSTFGTTPNVYTNSSGSSSLLPGTYESLYPLDALVGCPLNGTWTIEFCDLWGADDGFVCDWTIGFDPSLYPPITTFEPIYGNQCDSTYITPLSGPAGAIITSTSPDCNQVCITPTNYGTYQYLFTAIDDFGCSYDTLITVTVDSNLVVDTGNDTTVCAGDVITLNPNVSGGINPPPGCDYTLNMYDSFGDGWNGFSVEIFINGVSIGVYTFTTGTFDSATFNVQPGDAITITTVSGTWDSEVTYEIVDASGTIVWADGPNPTIGSGVWSGTASCPGGTSPYQYQWFPSTGLSNDTIANPDATINGQITYYVTVTETGHPMCPVTDSITIFIDPLTDAGLDDTISVCYNDPSFDMFTVLGGTPATGGTWYDSGWNPISNMFDPMVMGTGSYYYIVVGLGTCPPDTAQVDVTVYPAGSPMCGCGLAPAITFSNITCNGICDGTITIADPSATDYSIDGGSTFVTSNTFSGLCPGTYDIQVLQDTTCADSSNSVDLIEPTALSMVFNTVDATCFGACDGSATTTIGGGTTPYNYNWAGLAPSGSNFATGICANSYDLIVTDANGCTIDTLGWTIGEPAAISIDMVLITNETCYLLCDGELEVQSANGVNFSIDGGSTFQGTGTFSGLCPGSYDIVVEDANGCPISQTTSVAPAPPIIAGFEASPQPTTISNTSINFNNTSTNAVSYSWDFGGLESSNLENPIYLFPAVPGSYLVCLDVTDINGCPAQYCADVVINDELIIYVPNSFSPNGDGINDFFFPVVSGYDPNEFEFLIFNRWGELIFTSESPNTAWDGMYKGQLVPNDLFVWKLSAKTSDTNDRQEYIGHVTVVR